MFTFDFEETIQRPVEAVWSFLDTTSNGVQWQLATTDQRYTSPEPHGLGSVGLNARQVMGRHVETTWEIAEYTPERSFTLKRAVLQKFWEEMMSVQACFCSA